MYADVLISKSFILYRDFLISVLRRYLINRPVKEMYLFLLSLAFGSRGA